MTIFNLKYSLPKQKKLRGLRVVLLNLLIFIGVFFFPGFQNLSAQATANTQPVEIDLLVRGWSVRSPEVIFERGLKAGEKANITIRNQPEGEIGIKSVQQLPITILVPQPDGSVKELPDSKASRFNADLLIVLEGTAQMQARGPFFGRSQLKIGSPVDLEGFSYYLKGSIVDVRV